jgi:hypothetical protein
VRGRVSREATGRGASSGGCAQGHGGSHDAATRPRHAPRGRPHPARRPLQIRGLSTAPGTEGGGSSRSSGGGGGGGGVTEAVEVAGQKMSWSAGRLAALAHGACLARYGKTVVLSTVVADPAPVAGADGTQLQVRRR